MILCVYNRLRSMLDKGGAVKNFVNALQQLTNPEMIFKVIIANLNMDGLMKLPPSGIWLVINNCPLSHAGLVGWCEK